MDAKVTKAFADAADLSRTYVPGDRFSGSKERVEQLAAGGYVSIDKPARASKSKE